MVLICCLYARHHFRQEYILFLYIVFEQSHDLGAGLLQKNLSLSIDADLSQLNIFS